MTQTYSPFDDLNEINTIFGGDEHNFDTDGVVSKINESLKVLAEEAKDHKSFAGVSLIPVSSNQTGNFAAIVVCKATKDESGITAFINTLIIEASRPHPLERTIQTINGVNVPMFISVAHAYNENYLNVVSSVVRRQLGASAKVVDAGHSIIYNITDTEPQGMRPVLNDALKAITHALDITNPDRKVFRLAQVVGNPNIRIGSRVALDQDRKTANGMPVRADISSELYFSEQRSAAQTAVPDSRETAVVRTTAYVDLIYVPQTQNQFTQPAPWAQQSQVSYIPRIVITSWEAKFPRSNAEFMLLAIASMTSLLRSRSYGVVWRGHYSEKQLATRNLGAVGLQVPNLTADNKPAIIDTSNFSNLNDLMNTVLTNDAICSIDIVEGGTGDWAVDLIALAGDGDKDATNRIFEAGDNLTGGRLSQSYNELAQGQPRSVITWANEMGYQGTYVRDGELRDINEIDLLYLLNTFGKKDQQLVQDYLLALYGNEHIRIRMEKLERVLNLCANKVEIKAYTRKYNFNGVFIAALTRAIAESGLTINNSNLMQGVASNQYTQTIQNWQQNLVNPQAVNPLFQQQQQLNNQWGFGSVFRGGNQFYRQ